MPQFRTPKTIDCNARRDLLADFAYLAPLYDSPTFLALTEELGDDWQLQGADLDDAAFRIDAESRLIKINTKGLSVSSIMRSNYFRNSVSLNMLAAIRAAWQAERQADARAMHRPDLWPLLARIARADGAAMAVRMGFEMLDAGDEGLWRHILGDAVGDVAMEYARILEADINADSDDRALSAAFMAWFDRADRIRAADALTLSDMDEGLPAMLWEGRGSLSEGAVRCLSADPLTGLSYLGSRAGDLAGNPTWADITDPINQAHFLQIMDEIGTTRVGEITVRDARLAARLFPGLLEKA